MPLTRSVLQASFDASAVELMRRLADEAGRPYHLHPLAMLSYDIMPPPRKVRSAAAMCCLIWMEGNDVHSYLIPLDNPLDCLCRGHTLLLRVLLVDSCLFSGGEGAWGEEGDWVSWCGHLYCP